MIFTIEPMINAGRPGIRCLADGWTIVTADHSLSAQWEHTVLVTDDGFEVLTRLGRHAAAAAGRRRDRSRHGVAPPPAAPTTTGRRPAPGRRGRASRTGATSSRDGREALRAAFFAAPDTPRLLREHARLVDRVRARRLARVRRCRADLALLAVGGYGRGQLFPHSDVDVLVLLPASGDAAGRGDRALLRRRCGTSASSSSHAVRTIDECAIEMAADVTDPHEPAREPLPRRRRGALYRQFRAHVRRAHGRARVLRRQGARAAAAAPEVPRRDLQPRAQRQGKPRRPARPADGAVDRARRRTRQHVARARAATGS